MPLNERELVLIGYSDVGKTAMIKQLKMNTFEEEYTPTIDEVYCTKVEYDGKVADLAVNDVSGADAHNHLRNALMLKCEGIVAVYSVTNAVSFAMLQGMIEEFRPLAAKQEPKVNIILVGCKNDLVKDREVETDLGKGFAEKLNCTFKEISAKDREQVVDVFATLLHDIDHPPVRTEKEDLTWVPMAQKKLLITDCCSVL